MPISTIPGNMLGNSQIGQNAANLGVAIIENTQSITANYSISTGSSAQSVGPITIATGVAVTIPTGSKWVLL
jgi:hypothetical protein